ncbi:MAG: cob(I)yrinic acid a,c-diamide adenosyltransferase [Fimbriimonadaceae bacterium]|nr:cob(I)yrinic acid a,c-diamide adenosyltransferase [Fimbriimonadaceae bacterium]
MKIYTRTGDQGETGLIGGLRVAKTSPRINAIGDVDELNAIIGHARVSAQNDELGPLLFNIQNWLFEIGAEIASPGEARFETIESEAAIHLERSIDQMNDSLPVLTNFILPGGAELASRLHMARAVCRRAERTVLELNQEEPVREQLRIFLNRLADWLFVAARTANRLSDVQDVTWKRGN